ncbi:hypothetical protein [Burkholderia gladioli]|uniref:hypothetical protein n=1 Tax=Burkholderia gladioli TaxID=28095 RepID=UPI001640B424|nr:hypothetical protein [Burkholderia gladioli]
MNMDQKSGLHGSVGQVAAPAPSGSEVNAAQPASAPDAENVASTTNKLGAQYALRYAAEIKRLDGCPPKDVTTIDIVGFRFAFEDIDDPSNYLPVAVVKPERVIAGQPIVQCCTGYSLSVFNSLESLARKAKQVMKTSPLFLRRVGDHFVALKITHNAGVCTEPNASGHFDLFESEDFSYRTSVLNHGRLPL